MAIFGGQDHGTPFGAVRPDKFFGPTGDGAYSYSGFRSRAGVTGLTTGAYSGLCGTSGLAFLPFDPSLTFPLNYAVLQGLTAITWAEAAPPSPCEEVRYEVQFTRTLSRGTGWRTIASSVKGNRLDMDVSDIAYTEDGGFRVRARSTNGLFSRYSTTVEPFTIANHAPEQVRMVNPTTGENIDNDLVVSWIEAAPRDVDGHEVTYTVEFTSSYSGDSGWVVIPGGSGLPEGTTTFVADTFNLPEGDDYGVRVSAIDELGLAGTPATIGPLSIQHSGTFIIDTQPPTGSFVINDGEPLAAGIDVKLSLSASDAGTGIKDMRIGSDGDACFGDWEPFSAEKFWKLPASDGIKRVFVQFRDYAENISGVCDCEIVSRLVCSEGNVTALRVYNDKLYMAFDKNGNIMSYKALLADALTLPEDSIKTMEVFDGALYVATYDGTESFVYAFDGRLSRAFSLDGKQVSSMQAYGEGLFLATMEGSVYMYDGSSTFLSYSSVSAQVVRLRTDGKLLYAMVSEGGYFLAFNGSEWKSVAT